MRPDITKTHLEFLKDARIAFEHDEKLKTYRNDWNENCTLIALRRELSPDSDDIDVFEIKSFVGRFVEQVQRYES